MSEICCNQTQCKEYICELHPKHQPCDDPCKALDIRGICNSKPMEWITETAFGFIHTS